MIKTASDFAKEIILQAKKSEKVITNLKLQKTLYYVQGYHYRNFGMPAFEDDCVHWTYGPVYPSVYFEYSANGGEPLYADDDNEAYHIPKDSVVFEVVKKCFQLSARELVSKSHGETPWKTTGSNDIINKKAIYEYFSQHDPLGIG